MPQYRAMCEKLGDLAASQGAYAGAAKKYLDAGNKIKVSGIEQLCLRLTFCLCSVDASFDSFG